jgi:hypothetical protein
MTDHELTPTPAVPAASRSKQMPRPAIRAIAYSGYFCALTTAFLAFFAWRMGYHVGFVVLNVITAGFLVAGSWWMLAQLKATQP